MLTFTPTQTLRILHPSSLVLQHRWVPALAFWGAAGAGAVTLFLSGVPRFKEDILFKLPFVSRVRRKNVS